MAGIVWTWDQFLLSISLLFPSLKWKGDLRGCVDASLVQYRMYRALSAKQDGTYVAQQVFELPAWINFDRFKNAWNNFQEASAILRTRIIQSDAEAFRWWSKAVSSEKRERTSRNTFGNTRRYRWDLAKDLRGTQY